MENICTYSSGIPTLNDQKGGRWGENSGRNMKESSGTCPIISSKKRSMSVVNGAVAPTPFSLMPGVVSCLGNLDLHTISILSHNILADGFKSELGSQLLLVPTTNGAQRRFSSPPESYDERWLGRAPVHDVYQFEVTDIRYFLLASRWETQFLLVSTNVRFLSILEDLLPQFLHLKHYCQCVSSRPSQTSHSRSHHR
jgi:hypothetical protein